MPKGCYVCKQEIEEERVASYPETILCARHGGEVAKYGREYIMTSTREKTSKEGSLKKNYGSVITKLKHNWEALNLLRDAYLMQQLDEQG